MVSAAMHYADRNSRRHNIDEPHHAHTLTFSCYKGYQFLAAERTCRWLAEAIDAARATLDFSLWAYVFMPEHVHLIIFPRKRDYSTSAIRKAIKEPVGRQAVRYLVDLHPEWLPRITRKRGDRIERLFWQSGGGFDRNVVEPKTLQSAIEYLHLNPVRRGLVERASDWKWSSASWYEGKTALLQPDSIPPDWSREG
jgi:putative transposase